MKRDNLADRVHSRVFESYKPPLAVRGPFLWRVLRHVLIGGALVAGSLFSGVAFLSTVSLLPVRIVCRFLHQWHVDDDPDEG